MKTTKRFTSAVIVAAGSSLRMECKGNKNYLQIGESPALSLTLRAFDKCELIDEIVLVHKQGEEAMAKAAAEDACVKKKISYTAGGDTRSESVCRGLGIVDLSCSHVAIHDGARALITSQDITEVLLACYEYGAASAASRVTDTLCETKSDAGGCFIRQYINRDGAALIQTPQCFEYSLIKKAHENAREHRAELTDDTRLAIEAGSEVKLVFSKNKNLKMTEPEDLCIARAVIKNRLVASRQETEEEYAD